MGVKDDFKKLIDDFKHDPEFLHVKMDDFLLDLLFSEGYEEIVNMFKSQNIWYS